MNDISYIIKTKEFKLFKGQSKNKNVDCSTPKLLNSFNYIADKLQEHYSSVCKIYDEAPDFCCFEKKYLIHPSSSFRDELIILITTSKVLRKYGMQYVSIIKYISLLGRFLFANYTLIREKKDCFLSSFSFLVCIGLWMFSPRKCEQKR